MSGAVLPTLILIDVQRAFDDPVWGARNNPDAEARIAELLARWRAADAPIVHVRHRSASPDGVFRGDAFEFKPEAEPRDGEPVVEKSVNSAFIGTQLEQQLRSAGVGGLVLAGLTTDHCVSTTARMAGNLGFETWVVSDATATFDRDGFDAETMHRTALASLSGEFATVVDTSGAAALLDD